MQKHYTTRHLTAATTQLLLRAAPRRAWLALLIVFAVALALAAAGLFARYVRETLAAAPPIIIVATPTPQAPRAAAVPTPLPGVIELIGYYDYRDISTATPIAAGRLACVVGTAGGGRYLLVAVDTCDGDVRLWFYADVVPARVPESSLADLTPRTPAPPLASEPGYRTSYAPAEQVPEPVATELPPIFILPSPVPEQPATAAPGWGGGGGSGWDEAATKDGDFVCYGQPRVCYPVAP